MSPVLDSIPARFPSLSANVALDQPKVFGLPAVEASRVSLWDLLLGERGKWDGVCKSYNILKSKLMTRDVVE